MVLHSASWLVVKPNATVELRKSPRFLISVPIDVGPADGDRFLIHGLTLDLSQTGVGALLCGTVTPDSTVRVRLHLPAGPIETLAIVQHGQGPQWGFQFLRTSKDFERQLCCCLQKLTPAAHPPDDNKTQ
jgi:hypothetical protein